MAKMGFLVGSKYLHFWQVGEGDSSSHRSISLPHCFCGQYQRIPTFVTSLLFKFCRTSPSKSASVSMENSGKKLPKLSSAGDDLDLGTVDPDPNEHSTLNQFDDTPL